MRYSDNMEDSHASIGRMLPLVQEAVGDKGTNYMYLNRAQLLAYNFGARDTKVRAGRGVGKSTGFLSLRIINCWNTIPRSEGIFLGNSVKQLYTKTMPQVITGIEKFGWKEGIHFFRGQAPKKLISSGAFKMPIKKPRVWENVIHVYNGAVTYLVSMAIKASANGFNAAWICADETRYLPWRKVQEEVMPTLRGDTYDHPGWRRNENPYYLSQMWVSDAAITMAQSEWEKAEDEQTLEINEQIAEMMAELNVCPELGQAEEFINKLNRLRCQSRVFYNFSSLENVDILGEKYFADRKREMPELMFNIQILGHKKGVAKDGYYASFNHETHTYMPSDVAATDVIYSNFSKKFVGIDASGGYSRRFEYEAPDLGATSKIRDCSLDMDVLPSEPLRIAFDLNANINTVVTGQTYKRDGIDSLNILSSMFTKNERKLRALCGDWARYYEPQRLRNPNVILYYDSTAKQGGAYALEEAEDTRFYNVVKKELERRKWVVTLVPMGSPMSHPQKYQFVNDVLSGAQRPFLRLNRENNEYLIVAIENCRVKMSSRGPIKDKGQEKLKSEDGIGGKLETRTDITDALDTLIIGVRYFGAKKRMAVSMPVIRSY